MTLLSLLFTNVGLEILCACCPWEEINVRVINRKGRKNMKRKDIGSFVNVGRKVGNGSSLIMMSCSLCTKHYKVDSNNNKNLREQNLFLKVTRSLNLKKSTVELEVHEKSKGHMKAVKMYIYRESTSGFKHVIKLNY